MCPNNHWDYIKAVENKYREEILSLIGVVGVSTGVLRRSGEVIPCIRIYLNREIERGALEENKIPMEIEGIPIDVVITGDFKAFRE